MKLWQLKDSQSELKISKENPLLAKLLSNRNINTDEKAENFLNPELKDFMPFSVFSDSEKVLQRIDDAINRKEKIIVYGDFDTDGVTSTAIMYQTLSAIGADVEYYLPDRESENHGLNNSAILKLISKKKTKLIITVDCGVSNVNEVKLAKNFKTDIIITDHHEAPEVLPEAYAIINPKANGSVNADVQMEDIKSLCDLSGAGIAFKLASALLEKYNWNELYDEILSIACIGTIGDIVPLLNENRHIVYSGLKLIRNKSTISITKLIENAGINDFNSITSETIAFYVVPRINAVGRLKHADIALQLLVSKDEKEIEEYSCILNETNAKRQELCEQAFSRAIDKVEEEPSLYENSIVLCDEQAHIGIIGLSASKLVEKYSKPAFIMNKKDNIYRCSCRGLEGVNIYEILRDNADLFTTFGGHEFAGGFAFDSNLHSFDEIQKAVNNSVIEQTEGKSLLPILNIDAIVDSSDISINMVDTINKLQPFGAANPVPILEIDNQKVENINFIGKNANHLKMLCSSLNNGFKINCIKWQTDAVDFDVNDTLKLAFTPNINEFNGSKSVQVIINDIQIVKSNHNKNDELKTKTTNSVEIIDCRYQSGGFDKIINFKKKTKQKIAIYTEKADVSDFFNSNEETKGLIFSADNIPSNVDMVILVDFPPSLNFLKKLVKAGTRRILLMKYENFYIDFPHYLAKLSGMMKYVLNRLNGKTAIKAMRSVLMFQDELIIDALKILIANNILDAEIEDNSKIAVKNIKSFHFSEIKQDKEYLAVEHQFKEAVQYAETIINSPIEEIKLMVL